MATAFALPWGKPSQEQAESSAALRAGRLFAAGLDAAGLAICLHLPEAVTGLIARPLGSAVTTACEGQAETCINYFYFFLAGFIIFNGLVYRSFVPARQSGAGTGMFEINFTINPCIF